MEEVIKCPFQSGNYVFFCKANKGVYVPSLHEFQEYCKSNRYKICPLYLSAATMFKRPAKLAPPRIVKLEWSSYRKGDLRNHSYLQKRGLNKGTIIKPYKECSMRRSRLRIYNFFGGKEQKSFLPKSHISTLQSDDQSVIYRKSSIRITDLEWGLAGITEKNAVFTSGRKDT
jgi:hypothetical protein